MAGKMVGGLGELQKATAETQMLINSVRQAAEDQAGQKFEEFKAISFKSQVVAGINFFVKVEVDVGGGGKFVHLRVYQPLPHTGEPPKLDGIQLNKTADDEITYF